ncbi:MAG TPA: hypothetical protein VN969_19835 [Streptosporangiaceae bacterium]|nr:hypothetical protein [Streptosporangiaceae bacterium]
MPSTSESTQASSLPPGRSIRVISATMASAARWVDSARSNAMTPSAQASGRKSSRAVSPTRVRSRPGLAGGTSGSPSRTRMTVWPAMAAISALSARGPDTSTIRRSRWPLCWPGPGWPGCGSQATSLARATASWNRQ